MDDIKELTKRIDRYRKQYVELQMKYFELEKKKVEDYANLIDITQLQDNSVYQITVDYSIKLDELNTFINMLQKRTKDHNITWVAMHPAIKVEKKKDTISFDEFNNLSKEIQDKVVEDAAKALNEKFEPYVYSSKFDIEELKKMIKIIGGKYE